MPSLTTFRERIDECAAPLATFGGAMVILGVIGLVAWGVFVFVG